ncbi:MAG: metallophosphoesterase [Bryobacteraceae bacterium]
MDALRIPFTSDIVVDATIATTQILIARLFFAEWKRLLPSSLSKAMTYVLYTLWAVTVAGTLLRYATIVRLVRWVPVAIRSTLIAAGNVWGMTAVASLGIYYAYRFLTRNLSLAHSPDRRRLIHAVGTAAVAAPFAVAGFGAIVERTNFQVKEIDLPVPNLHPDLEGLRIGQLSDLHVSPWLSVRELGRAVDMLNELKPQLTVVTGDLITQLGDPLDDTIRELARLRADAGVLGCLGNHEYYIRCQNYATVQARRYGIEFLRHKARLLRWGNGLLNVAGVDFQRPERIEPYLIDAEKLVTPGAANLLLSHNPDVFPAAVRKGYDTMLSGHTHGGQVTVEFVNQTLNLARFFTPYVAGLYRLEGRSCYVNTGIGTIAMPVRIGAPPEITLARLRKA